MQDNRAKPSPAAGRFRPTATLSAIAPTDGTTAFFPEGYPLRQATFARRRDHLLVRAPDHADVVVPRFFGCGAQTTLATRDGVEVSRHMVRLILNLSPRVERALNELAVPGCRDL